MRTIKFLGFITAMSVAALSAGAQGGLPQAAQPQANIQPGQFPALDRLARFEANRLVHRQQLRALRGARGRFSGRGVAAGPRHGMRAGVRADIRAGGRAGFSAGRRVGRMANATAEQKAFVEQWRTQRQSIHAQVLEGKLTRQQARAQMQAWITEHRPKK